MRDPPGAFPPERGLGDGDEIVRRPGERERLDAAGGENFGQARGVAERIGRPRDAHGLAEAAFEISLAVQKVPREGFGVGQIGVGLNDRPADRIPPPRFTYFLMRAKVAGSVRSMCS